MTDYGPEDFATHRWTRRRLGYRLIDLASRALSPDDRRAFRVAVQTGIRELVTEPLPAHIPTEETR